MGQTFWRGLIGETSGDIVFDKQFSSKADAFDWMNKVDATEYLDMPKLLCEGQTRLVKTPFGIFDNDTQSYVKGSLPVEHYA